MNTLRSNAPGSTVGCLLLFAVASCGAGSGQDGENDPESETAGGASDRVELTAAQMSNAGVAFGVVEERPIGEYLEATAEIEPAPSRFAQLGARVTGRVTRVLVAEGDRVTIEQTLAIIDSPELGQATGDYLAAVTTADVAREIADRERALFERQISSEREWRQAGAEAVRSRAAKEAAENRLHALGLSEADLQKLQVERHFSSEVAVRSPLAGVVSSRTAAIGKIVQPGEGLFEVVDLAQVAIAIDVYEQSLTRVRPGQRVEVRTGSTGSTVFRGQVTSVGAVVERQSRTVKARVLLDDPERVLRPGMFATVRVLGAGNPDSSERGVYVPSAAVQRDRSAMIVFLKVGPRAFERREVDLGSASAGFARVERGLAPGDTVVTTGSLALKAELKRGEFGERE